MTMSAEERLDLTSVRNLFRVRVKSYYILGRSDHILVIYDNKLIIVFMIQISSMIRWLLQHKFQNLGTADWYQSCDGESSRVKLPNLLHSVNYRNLLHWKHTIKYCYFYNKTVKSIPGLVKPKFYFVVRFQRIFKLYIFHNYPWSVY